MLIQENYDPLRMTRGTDPAGAWLFQALLLDTMTIYTGKGGPATVLRIKLTKVLYVPWILQWCSILRSQADASSATDLLLTFLMQLRKRTELSM
jgi:hypothetical protein